MIKAGFILGNVMSHKEPTSGGMTAFIGFLGRQSAKKHTSESFGVKFVIASRVIKIRRRG